MFSSICASFSTQVFSGAEWLKQQWNSGYGNSGYDQVKLILTDEPIVYRTEEYFPKDVQKVLKKDKMFLQMIKAIKRGIREKQYTNDWLLALNEALEEVKESRLSLCSFALGLEQLESMETIPGILRDWIAFAKQEGFKFISCEQFRLSLYVGLWQAIQNKIEADDWLKNLEIYGEHLADDIYSSLISKATTFAKSYLGLQSSYREMVYPVPLFAYKEFFNAVEQIFTPNNHNEHNLNGVDIEINTIDYINLLPSVAKDLWQWLKQHPKEIVFSGLLAGAWYQTQAQDKYQPLQWTSNVMVSLGVQQVLQTRGMQSFVPLAFALSSQILSTSAQNNPFFTVFAPANNNGYQEVSNALVETSDNSLMVAGIYQVSGISGTQNGLLTKFAANGSSLWARIWGGSSISTQVNAIIRTSDNNLVVAGSYQSSSLPLGGVLLAKFDVNGTFLWAKTLGGSNGISGYAQALQQTSDNGLVVTGIIFGATANNALLAKFTANGTFLWAKTLSGSGISGYTQALQQTSDNGLLILASNALIKFDNNGNFLWAKTLGGTTNVVARALLQASDGSLVLAGYANSSGTGYDALLAKFTAAGNPLWARTLGGSNGGSVQVITQTNDSGLVVTGSFGTGLFSGSSNALVAKFTTNGTFLWAKILGGNRGDYANALLQTSDGGLAVAGYTSSFGPSGSGSLLAKLDINGILPLNCVDTITPNISDISANISSNIASFTINVLNPSISSQVLTITSLSQAIEYPCAPLPNLTSSPTAFMPTNIGLPTSSNNVAGPIVGAVLGTAAAVTLIGGGTLFYLWRRKKQHSANNLELQGDRIEKTRTIIGKKYALINKITEEEAKALKAQAGLEVTFAPGKRKARLVIGKGQFGKLRLAQIIETKEFVGVKKIKGEKEIAASREEALLQKELNGLPNIMPLLDSIETTGSEGQPVLYQFMPLAGFGNGDFLKHLLSKADESTKEKVLTYVLFSLLTGLKHMHEHHIYHLDLKPSNFVLSPTGKLWIIDFGCAVKSTTALINPTNGDTRYFSPERLACYKDSNTFDAASADIWALGVTMLELIVGKYPFDTTLNFQQRVQYWDKNYFKQVITSYLSNVVPTTLLKIIESLLDVEATTRMSISQALESPIFRQAGISLAEQANIFILLKNPETQGDTFSQSESNPRISNQNYAHVYTTNSKGEIIATNKNHKYSNVPNGNASTSFKQAKPSTWASNYENVQPKIKQEQDGPRFLVQFGNSVSQYENVNPGMADAKKVDKSKKVEELKFG